MLVAGLAGGLGMAVVIALSTASLVSAASTRCRSARCANPAQRFSPSTFSASFTNVGTCAIQAARNASSFFKGV